MLRTTLALLLALAPATAFAGPHRDAVMDLLNGIEQPVSQQDLAAIGDGVDAELMEIADDAEVPTSRRGRAVTALQFYKTEAVRSFLDAKLAQTDSSLMARKAAWALAGGWGSEATPDLVGLLTSDDVQLRIALVKALGRIGDPAAQAALQARKGSETEAAVLEAIDKALGVAQ